MATLTTFFLGNSEKVLQKKRQLIVFYHLTKLIVQLKFSEQLAFYSTEFKPLIRNEKKLRNNFLGKLERRKWYSTQLKLTLEQTFSFKVNLNKRSMLRTIPFTKLLFWHVLRSYDEMRKKWMKDYSNDFWHFIFSAIPVSSASD
jgi:hypothetical protein